MNVTFCLQELSNEAEDKKPEMDEARRLCKQLVDNTKEPSTKFDLKNKLANVERPYTDLTKKIGAHSCYHPQNGNKIYSKQSL